MNRRCGVSLVEMMVAMTIGSVLLGIVVAMLATLLRTQGVARDELVETTQLARLGEQFRRDVHAATSVVAETEGNADAEKNAEASRREGTWKFTMPSGDTVTYRATGAALLRIETPGQGAATERRESFALPPSTAATIEVDDASRPQVVTLVITPSTEVEPHGTLPRRPQSTRFEAVLARDQRFMASRFPATPPAKEDAAGEKTDQAKSQDMGEKPAAEKPSNSTGKEEPAGEKTDE